MTLSVAEDGINELKIQSVALADGCSIDKNSGKGKTYLRGYVNSSTGKFSARVTYFVKKGTYKINITNNISGQPSYTLKATFRTTDVIYRLYNTVNQEHLYTTDVNEVNSLVYDYGWNYEGSAWSAPAGTGTPVYRLYSPVTNAHLYTADKNERDTLAESGVWSVDNAGDPVFYSASTGTTIYRLYNEGIQRRLLTTNKDEYDYLAANGWNGEGAKFFCSALGDPDELMP